MRRRYPKAVPAKDVIENTEDIKYFEGVFGKKIGESGKIHDIAKARSRSGTRANITPDLKSHIHTHGADYMLKSQWHLNRSLYKTEADYKRAVSFFSVQDLTMILGQTYWEKNYNLRNFHLAILDYNAKVEGYLSIRLSNKFVDACRNSTPEIRDFEQQVLNSHVEDDPHKIIARQLFEALKSGFGVTLHRTAIPGYIYRDGYFQKKMIES